MPRPWQSLARNRGLRHRRVADPIYERGADPRVDYPSFDTGRQAGLRLFCRTLPNRIL